jgi:hypothetical protein
VLLLHFAVVLFVVGGLVAIVVGNRLDWGWVDRRWFRLAHLAAVGVIVAQAWLGKLCPLTTLEAWLRTQAGAPAYQGSFIEYWLQRLIYFDAPAWAFTLAYTVFAVLVAAVWWKYPPRRR